MAPNEAFDLTREEWEQAATAHTQALARAGVEAPRIVTTGGLVRPGETPPPPDFDPATWLAEAGIRLGPSQVCPKCRASFHGPPGECWECGRTAEAAQKARDITRTNLGLFRDEFSDYFGCTLGSEELQRRLKSAEAKSAAGRAEEFLAMSRLAFVGPSGSAKTSLMSGLFREWIRRNRGRPARMVIACDLAIARTQFSLGQGEPGIVDEADDAHLLVIDDLGNEQTAQSNAINDVLQRRFNKTRRGLVTWVTSAFTFRQARKRYGDGIARRVFGDCTVRFGAMPHDDP